MAIIQPPRQCPNAYIKMHAKYFALQMERPSIMTQGVIMPKKQKLNTVTFDNHLLLCLVFLGGQALTEQAGYKKHYIN